MPTCRCAPGGDPHPCDVEEARRKVKQALGEIMDALIAKTKETGSYLHARFLFEFAGISAAPPEGEAEEGLAQTLIRRLGLSSGDAADPPPPPDVPGASGSPPDCER